MSVIMKTTIITIIKRSVKSKMAKISIESKKIYVCIYCGSNYNDENAAYRCNEIHQAPQCFESLENKYSHHAGEKLYPIELEITFENGQTVTYIRHDVCD